MAFPELAQAILKLLALAAIGVGLRATGAADRQHAKVLNSIIMYVALPALVFRVTRQADFSLGLLRVAVVAWLVGLAGFGIAWGIARLLRLPRRTAAAFMLVTALGNTGYIGYPVATMLFGEKSLPQAVFYDVFGTVALLFSVGVLIAARFGDDEEPISVVREVLRAPAMIALLAGLASRLFPVPAGFQTAVMDWLGIVANMTVPLVMISLGLTLTASGFRGRFAVFGLVGAVKLLVLPEIAFVAASLLGEVEGMRLVMLQAGMPSMMLTLVIGERFDLDTDFIASAILLTTIASVFTVPLMQMLLA